MPQYAKPAPPQPRGPVQVQTTAHQWLAQLRGLATANAAGGTDYIVEYPRRSKAEAEAGTPESERGVPKAIIGDISHDQKGTSTGLSGWGIAVYSGGKWTKVTGGGEGKEGPEGKEGKEGKEGAPKTAKSGGGLEIVGTEIGVKAKGVTDGMLAEVYALLAGRTGGQTLVGGTGESDTLTFTAHTGSPPVVLEASTLNLGEGVALKTTLISGLHNLTASEAVTSGSLSVTEGPTSLAGRIGLTPLTPTELKASTNNWEPGAGSIIRVKAEKALNLTGIVANLSLLGEVLILTNVGTFTTTLVNNATSTEKNRFKFSTEANIELKPEQSIVLWYDGTTKRWRDGARTAGNVNLTGTQTIAGVKSFTEAPLLTKGIGLWAHAAPASQHAALPAPKTLLEVEAWAKEVDEVLKEYGLTA